VVVERNTPLETSSRVGHHGARGYSWKETEWSAGACSRSGGKPPHSSRITHIVERRDVFLRRGRSDRGDLPYPSLRPWSHSQRPTAFISPRCHPDSPFEASPRKDRRRETYPLSKRGQGEISFPFSSSRVPFKARLRPGISPLFSLFPPRERGRGEGARHSPYGPQLLSFAGISIPSESNPLGPSSKSR
jgi:hypothetical protein